MKEIKIICKNKTNKTYCESFIEYGDVFVRVVKTENNGTLHMIPVTNIVDILYDIEIYLKDDCFNAKLFD